MVNLPCWLYWKRSQLGDTSLNVSFTVLLDVYQRRQDPLWMWMMLFHGLILPWSQGRLKKATWVWAFIYCHSFKELLLQLFPIITDCITWIRSQSKLPFSMLSHVRYLSHQWRKLTNTRSFLDFCNFMLLKILVSQASMVAQVFNPNTRETESGRYLRVQGQPDL